MLCSLIDPLETAGMCETSLGQERDVCWVGFVWAAALMSRLEPQANLCEALPDRWKKRKKKQLIKEVYQLDKNGYNCQLKIILIRGFWNISLMFHTDPEPEGAWSLLRMFLGLFAACQHRGFSASALLTKRLLRKWSCRYPEVTISRLRAIDHHVM